MAEKNKSPRIAVARVHIPGPDVPKAQMIQELARQMNVTTISIKITKHNMEDPYHRHKSVQHADI